MHTQSQVVQVIADPFFLFGDAKSHQQDPRAVAADVADDILFFICTEKARMGSGQIQFSIARFNIGRCFFCYAAAAPNK